MTGHLGAGNDEVYGGNQATGAVIDGGADADWLHYELVNGPVSIDLAAGTAVRGAVTDTVTNFENATGTNASDVLLGILERTSSTAARQRCHRGSRRCGYA